MSFKQDYIYNGNDDFDLLIQSGDFRQDQANDNQAKVIMKAGKGEIREYVLLGAAIDQYIGSTTDIDIIENAIKSELRKDNIVMVDIDTIKTNSTITTNIDVQ